MFLYYFKNTYLFLVLLTIICSNIFTDKNLQEKTLIVEIGADQTKKYLPFLKNKKIAIIANHTSVITKGKFNKISKKNDLNTHLIDSLIKLGINVKKIFTPEHGFRGKAYAGAVINDKIDKKTALPIISLYGKTKKPSKENLKNIDIVIFDIQDVGVRFYTYISTLHYVMEACAESNIPLIILDRPNPNGFYIDGPVLETEFKSFVGMHPVPVVYGMTIGEYGKMINGEGWLKNKIKCNLKVIPIKNYTHKTKYILPINPSPNLPNEKSINLYPSLCFFEGTNVSVGRGTNMQFQIYGSPFLPKTNFSFIPTPNLGSKNPKYNGKLCFGENLKNIKNLSSINLSWLIKCYNQSENKKTFWNPFFIKLSGTKSLRKQIESCLPEKEIKKSWEKGLNNFKKIRKKYLIYK